MSTPVMDASPAEAKATALPRLWSPAPPFEAETTRGTLRLEDFKGGWLILFSHPADFTPVCTTEFLAFAKIAPELKKRRVELLGLSIDSTQ
jgi:peroxiredoxin 2/4